MKIDPMIARRFAELSEQANKLPVDRNHGGFPSVAPQHWQQWATSAHHLIESVFGSSSAHHKNFAAAYAACKGWTEEVDALKGIFHAAKADYEGGYLFRVEAAVSGEIFGDFISAAKIALSEGAKDVAAVLACAALEDALKRFAAMNGLDVSEKVMQEVVGALKSKGLVTGAQKSLLDTMPKIRDYAMHANWDKITPQDVGSVIGFTEQILLTNFS